MSDHCVYSEMRFSLDSSLMKNLLGQRRNVEN